MTAKVDQLVERAMVLGSDVGDDTARVVELRRLARGDESALERAMQASLAMPASLAARHRAIELLARARYEDPSLRSFRCAGYNRRCWLCSGSSETAIDG